MEERDDSKLGDRVASLCQRVYSGLGKTGKPKEGLEWSLLSGIVLRTGGPRGKLEAVALGTGTKCLGAGSMSPTGSLLNDSHAEVMARRAFLRFLYEEVERTLKEGSSEIFSGLDERGRCRLQGGVEFHFYTSHVPCGDASIVPMRAGERREGRRAEEEEGPRRKKMKGEASERKEGRRVEEEEGGAAGGEEEEEGPRKKKRKSEEDEAGPGRVVDVHRTGAKCLPQSGVSDPRGAGLDYHLLAVVRTKPGRGDPTLSVSCSDKLARWISQGLQGSLLGLLMDQPIRMKSLTVGGGGQACRDSLERALLRRWTRDSHGLHILNSDLFFDDSRYLAPPEADPCPASIYWTRISHPVKTEVSVEGRKQGCTKKMLALGKGRLKICKHELYRKFLNLAPEFRGKSYREAKDSNVDYRSNFARFKELMGAWTDKPNFEDFIVEV